MTGNGTRMENTSDALEAALRNASAPTVGPADQTDAGDVAQQAMAAVQACRDAAEHVRSMGNMFLSIAQTVKTTGDTLALDIESRADLFSKMVSTASDYAKQTHETFEKERERLNSFKIPHAHGA